MSGPATGNKVCIICGTDCSRIPRVKDTNGKYYCRDCYYPAKQKKAASRSATNVAGGVSDATLPAAPRYPAPAPVSIDDAIPIAVPLDDDTQLLDQAGSFETSSAAMPGQIYCPDCSCPMGADAVICTHCGFNRRTGKRLRQMVDAGPAAAPGKGPGAAAETAAPGTGSSIFGASWFIGAAVLAVLGSLALLSRPYPALSGVYVAVSAMIGFSMLIWILVTAFSDKVVHGIVTLVTCGFYGYVYGFFLQPDKRLKFALGAVLLMSFVGTPAQKTYYSRYYTQFIDALEDSESQSVPQVAVPSGRPNNVVRPFAPGDPATQKEIEESLKTIEEAMPGLLPPGEGLSMRKKKPARKVTRPPPKKPPPAKADEGDDEDEDEDAPPPKAKQPAKRALPPADDEEGE